MTGRLSRTPTVVLASASAARLAVLRAAGIDPVVRVSGVDEDAVQAANADAAPEDLVATLAAAKAGNVARQLDPPEPAACAVVLGCDSMLQFGGRLLGKPKDATDAGRYWAEMSGGAGDLLTGHAVALVTPGGTTLATGTCRTTVRFSAPTPAEIAAYVATGEPLSVAGAFTIDGLGGWFIEGVDGDPSSVVGISLPLTRRLLAEVGISVTDLWNRP